MPSNKNRAIGYLDRSLDRRYKEWLEVSGLGGSETVKNALYLLISIHPDQYQKLENSAWQNGRSIYGEARAIFIQAVENHLKELDRRD